MRNPLTGDGENPVTERAGVEPAAVDRGRSGPQTEARIGNRLGPGFGALVDRPTATLTAALALLSLFAVPAAASADHEPLEIADRIVVEKAARRLHLLKAGEILKSFRIALGPAAAGHKEEEGDLRTPEGVYRLDRRNPNSDYFLSIRISYPNAEDRRRAARRGTDPGGQIMIHGQPNEPKYSADFYRSQDWTNGCIAVSNSAMVDIWLMTRDGTPIEIRP